jgi:CHAD domain-containing protein
MKKILNLIEKYQNNSSDVDILHDLRVACRTKLSILNHNSKDDLGLKLLIKNSNKIRDCDVLIEKCEYIEILKYLHKKREKAVIKFIQFLDDFKSEVIDIENKEHLISKKKCLKSLKLDFLSISDEELHKIRIFIKRCRYVFSENREEEKLTHSLKEMQTFIGESRDYYNCIKLMKKFKLDFSKEKNKKLELIKNANEVRIKFLKENL